MPPPQQPYSEHGNAYSALLLAFLMSSCGVALAFVPLTLTSTHEERQFTEQVIFFTTPLGGVYAICMTAIFLWCIARREYWVHIGLVKLPQRPTHGKRFSLPIIIFGFGSVLLFMCYLIKHTLEGLSDAYDIALFINDGIYVVAFVIFLIFLKQYQHVSLKNYAFFHYVIALIIGGGVCVWTTVIICPFWETLPFTNTTILPAHYDHQQVKSGLKTFHASPYSIMKIIEAFLRPFFVEFLTVAMGILLDLWQTMRYTRKCIPHNLLPSERDISNNQDEECTQHYPGNQEVDLIPQDVPILDETIISSTVKSKRYRIIVTFVSVLLALGYLAAGLTLGTGPFQKYVSKNLPDSVRVILYRVVEFGTHLPLYITNIVILYRIRRSPRNISLTTPLTSSDYLLLLLAALNFTYLCLKIIDSLGGLISEFSQIYLTFSLCTLIISVIHIWIQTRFLLTINYLHRAGATISNLTKCCLINLAVMNIADWLQMSLGHEWAVQDWNSYPPDMGSVFGVSVTRASVLVLFPFLEIYHFHAAVMAYEMLC